MSNEVKVDTNAWMDTLSDLLFLLITFFVLLISMSSLDAKALKATFGFFDDAVGVLNFPQASAGTNLFMDILNPLAAFMASKESISSDEEVKEGESTQYRAAEGVGKGTGKSTSEFAMDFIEQLAKGLASKLPSDVLLGTLKPLAKASKGKVHIEKVTDGISVSIAGRLLFKDGQTELDEQGLATLRNVATIVKLWGGDADVIAAWTWRDGPAILARIIEEMEKQWILGKSLHPQLQTSAERSVSFVLRQRSE